MHTFKPGMPVTINEGAVPSDHNNKDDREVRWFYEWMNKNTSFKVTESMGDYIRINGDQFGGYYPFSPSDLTPKSEVFKVRIKTAAYAKWYYNMIGKEVEVTEHKDDPEWFYYDSKSCILKSDCIVVTDQKFKEGDPVKLYSGNSGVVKLIDKRRDQIYNVLVEFPGDGQKWCNPDFLSLIEQQPTSLPFTEELFNQGKYSIHYDDMPVDGFHSFEGMYLGKIGSDWKQLNAERLTLREKEVVVYIVPYVGLPYTSLDLAIDQARLTKNIVLRWNATTRTVEKVWDYLTDKK